MKHLSHFRTFYTFNNKQLSLLYSCIVYCIVKIWLYFYNLLYNNFIVKNISMDNNLKGTILLIYYANNNTYITFIQSCRTTKVLLLIVLLFLFFTLRIELFNRIFPSKMKGCTTHCVFISGQNTVKTRVLPVLFFDTSYSQRGNLFFPL